jgi:TonB family protein
LLLFSFSYFFYLLSTLGAYLGEPPPAYGSRRRAVRSSPVFSRRAFRAGEAHGRAPLREKTARPLPSLSRVASLRLVPPPIEKIIFDDRAETMPHFPACQEIEAYGERKQCADQKMMEFIYREIRYPAEALAKKIEGMVVISFEVDELGNLHELTIRKRIGGGCEEEALRIVQKMAAQPEKWTPSTFQGKVVKARYNVPIRFKLLKK